MYLISEFEDERKMKSTVSNLIEVFFTEVVSFTGHYMVGTVDSCNKAQFSSTNNLKLSLIICYNDNSPHFL